MVDINESGNKRMDADNSKKLKIKKKSERERTHKECSSLSR